MIQETNTNTNQKIKNKIEDGDDINMKIKLLEKHNTRLLGESTILRQNLVTLEKENYELKEIQNNNYIDGFKKSEEVKKELKVLQIENRIKENQLKAFKKTKNIVVTEDLKPSWIFDRINADIKFCLYPFEYERLKILHDYFYDEFEKLLSDPNIFNEILKHRDNSRSFYKFFMLFSDKKELFDKMFKMFFLDYSDSPSEKKAVNIYKVLYACDLAWIIQFIDIVDSMNLLNDFLDQTVMLHNSLLFYWKVAKQRPFLLGIFLPTQRFQALLTCKHSRINYLLDTLDDKTLEEYINVNTIDLLDPIYLKRVFKDKYFET